jgi:hypothetical protein
VAGGRFDVVKSPLRTKSLCALVLILALLAAPLSAQVLSFEEAKERADAGDAFAQAVVALHYQLGWNTEKNPELAVKYAGKSANAGEPLGQFRLGALMRAGEGIAKDEEQGLAHQAASFNGLAAAQDPYSITSAAIMIFQGKVVGQGVPQDERRKDAANLYKKAADMGYAPAQFNYAMCAEAGHGIPQNESLRIEYLTKAAENGYRLAAEALNKNETLTQSAISDDDSFGSLGAERSSSVAEVAERQNVAERNEPSMVFQYRDPSAVVVAENDKIKLASSMENVLYLLHKRTGLVLGQAELGPGAIKSAVLSPNSQYLAVQFHNASGAGASFRIYNLSSGTPRKVADHWPDAPAGWLNPSNEPEYMRHFANRVERIGIRGNESLVYECEGQLFSVGLLSDQSEPQVLRSRDMVKFSQPPAESKSTAQPSLQDGFWSAAQFLSDTQLILTASLPDVDEVFKPLFTWRSASDRVLQLDLTNLDMKTSSGTSPRVAIAEPTRLEQRVATETYGNVEVITLHNKYRVVVFDYRGHRGTDWDWGFWYVVRNLQNGATCLLVPSLDDLGLEEHNKKTYKERQRALRSLAGGGHQEVLIDTAFPVLAADEGGHFAVKDHSRLIRFDAAFEVLGQMPWASHEPFEFLSFSTDASLAVGLRRAGLTSPNSIQLFNTQTKQTIGDLVVGSRGAVLLDPEGNYIARGSLPSVVGFRNGLEAYPFEQFDLRLNRPDIVLERLGAPDEAVEIAKQLREKRLKRMGVTEEMLKPDFHVPELAIVGDVPSTTDSNEINVRIKASDNKYPLERLKVYVNNVPVNGRDGELLREEARSNQGLLGRITGAFSSAPTGPQTLERTIPIKLAAGRNKIQISVLNNAGAESLYANVELNCTAQRPRPTLYAVALGVSDYANPEWSLKYAAKDARDVLERLKTKSASSYGEVKELLLTDKEVTKESLAQIKDFLKDATIDDTVLMFVAGHGLLDSKYDYYFGTTDIDFNNPADKGIAFEEFDDLLAGLPSLKKSLLIDTCHAGELDEEEKALLASAGGTTAPLPTGNGIAMRSIGTRGMNVKAIEGARGASEWYDRLQGLFVDLRRGSGSTILSSSAGAEYALESSEQQNGLFTYAVLEALDGKPDADTNKDGSVQMSELGEYVKKRVSELTNNKQTPNTRRVNLEGDFTLAKTK